MPAVSRLLLRSLLGCLLGLLLALGAAAAPAAPALLAADTPAVEGWPAATLLRDPGTTLDAAGARAAAAQFTPPDKAYGTL